MPIKFGWAIDVPSRVSANGRYSRAADIRQDIAPGMC
jgi:hypothetical protein